MNNGNSKTTLDRMFESRIGVIGVTAILFPILKLIGIIDWSWWWVVAPLLGMSISLFVTSIGISIYLAVRLYDAHEGLYLLAEGVKNEEELRKQLKNKA